MIQNTFTVCSNRALTDTVYRMVLEGPLEGAITAPGQFVNLKLPGYYLRRPISVCEWTEDTVTLIYKVVGHGTDTPLLIGGGVGIPPLYGLCKALLAEGKTPSVILGFNTAGEIFLQDEFEALLEGTDGNVFVTTVDGSAGTKGFVTDVMKDLTYSFFYTCGPLPMFKAIESVAKTSGQYSFEERMGCGFGACMGCSIKTKNGNKRVCKDGPVLMREEVLW